MKGTYCLCHWAELARGSGQFLVGVPLWDHTSKSKAFSLYPSGQLLGSSKVGAAIFRACSPEDSWLFNCSSLPTRKSHGKLRIWEYLFPPQIKSASCSVGSQSDSFLVRARRGFSHICVSFSHWHLACCPCNSDVRPRETQVTACNEQVDTQARKQKDPEVKAAF